MKTIAQIQTIGGQSPDCQPEQPKDYKTDDRECVTKITGQETPRIEQPNQNLMIITEIEGLMSQVNDKLEQLPIDCHEMFRTKLNQALEEIDLFQKTTLFELRRAFE